MKIIYLGAYKANHPNYDIVYQDINGKRDLAGDMLEIDLTPYDVIIATPPCNYWSRANYRRETSTYSQKTKHLLPAIIDKCISLGKPFIVENVRNRRLFNLYNLFNKNCYIIEHGRHTYWTNVEVDLTIVPQEQDYRYGGYYIGKGSSQGGDNVHKVIEYWLKELENEK